jgi:hypothetical protein
MRGFFPRPSLTDQPPHGTAAYDWTAKDASCAFFISDFRSEAETGMPQILLK